MGGKTGEIQIRSERELYKYINHHAGTSSAKARSKNNMSIDYIYNIFGLGIPEYSSEVMEKDTNYRFLISV